MAEDLIRRARGAVPARALLLAGALLAAPAHALPWVVDDVAEAEALRAQLEALWPVGPIDVIVGPAPDADHLAVLEGALVWRHGGAEYRRDGAGVDPATAVLLARAWLREARLPEGGWTPGRAEGIDAPIELTQPPTPPAPRRRLTLPPPRLGVGLGARTSLAGGLSLDGPRVVAGARFGGWGAEVELFAAAGSYLRESALDRQLEALVPGIRRSAFLDVFGAALVGEWGVPAPGRGEGPRGGPALRAGVELRRAVLREVHYDSGGTFQVTLLREVDALDVGPVLGAGVDLWLGGGGRLRVCAVDRARLRRLAPTAPRRWDHELVLLLDLIVSPGSF